MIKKLYSLFTQDKHEKYFDNISKLDSCRAKTTTNQLIILIAIILTSIFTWASLTDIDEIAKTQGEIVPQTKIQIIQHHLGGTIKEIFVSDGQHVKKGQALFNLDPTSLKAELEKSILKVISLTANKIRLKATLNHKQLNFADLLNLTKQEIVIPNAHSQSIANMLKDSVLLSTLQNSTDFNEIAALKQRVAQNQIELNSLLEKSSMLKSLVDVMHEERQMYVKLNDKGLASRREMLNAKRKYLNLKKDWLGSIQQIKKQKRILKEINSTLEKETNNNNLESAQKLNDINTNLLQEKRNIVKLQDQYDKLIIRSPVDGIIKDLKISSGSVISPNETMTDIVPTSASLMIETKISSRDIGHVKIGAEVKIKVTAYDYARYGMMKGVLKRISATTFLDEKTNEVYYKGIIFLKHNYLGKRLENHPLLPGMLVEADIHTGKKSIMDYLLKPIYNSLNNSLSER